MANYYDPAGIKRTADAIKTALAEFETAQREIDAIVISLNSDWDDVVNQQFSRSYLQHVKPAAEKLDTLMERYAELLYQCARRYGTAIDSGNTYLTSF